MKDSRISTIVCTHPGFLEDMNFIMSPIAPGFTPKAEVKNVPFFSTFLNSMESFYVNRAASPEETNKLLERIMQRQKDIEDLGLNWNPIHFYAEGTTTNGT
jgi:hypothetical protein